MAMNDLDVKEMVARHDEAITHVTISIDRLATAVEKTDDKMDKVVEALSQNAVILEKIANIDSYNKDSVNRLHRRVDDVLNIMDQKESAIHKLLESTTADAKKGSNVYDIAVYTVKALAWGVPIATAILTGILWMIGHI